MTRLHAAASALAVTAGALTMLLSLAAAPGSWLTGYVSEAGTATMPYAIPYRAGLVLLAAGVALLGAALRLPLTSPALFAAAGLAAVSGLVPCSNQCPLPPYEPTTLADVVHAGATILGMLTLALAMTSVWYAATRPSADPPSREQTRSTAPSGPPATRDAQAVARWWRFVARRVLSTASVRRLAARGVARPVPLRRLSAAAVLLTVPLGAALGLTMLITGRGPLGAALERLLLAESVLWLVSTAVVLALPAHAPPTPAGHLSAEAREHS
ncbi:DUF998 domain-containing protein [Actinoplanes sp. NPDC049596]|uniref:DUF998 domain-containing protein n=1 Tax=unclassified Actinoplanes TaxID=2626549 RepID=UPI0034219A34